MTFDQWAAVITGLSGLVLGLISLLRLRPQNLESSTTAIKNMQETVDSLSKSQQDLLEEVSRLRALRGSQKFEVSITFTHTASGDLVVDAASVRKAAEVPA